MRPSVATIHIDGTIVRAFQKIESGEVEQEAPARPKDPMHFVRRERIIHAGVAQNVKRENEVEIIFRERKIVHVRRPERCVEVARRGQLDCVAARIDTRKISVRKILPDDIEHAAGAAAGVEEGKIRRGGRDRCGHVLAQRLVPPIAVLDGTHDVVFLRCHGDFLSRRGAIVL